MTSQKTKKVLEVMFADQEISFIGTTQLDMPIDGPGTKLLIAAAEEIDKNGKTAFSQALLPGGPGHISDHITFDSTKDKTRVIIFNNDRGTMPVVAVFSESNEWV